MSVTAALIITNKKDDLNVEHYSYMGALLQKHNIQVGGKTIISQSPLATRKALSEALNSSPSAPPSLIIVCGGTGIGPSHRTADEIEAVANFAIPGFGELMRAQGGRSNPKAYLGRCGGWVKGSTLILGVSSNKQAMDEQISAISTLIPDALDAVNEQCKSRSRRTP